MFSQEVREELLQAFEGCGLSAAEFCRQRGISAQTFSTWRRRAAEASLPVPLFRRVSPEQVSRLSDPSLTLKIGIAEVLIKPGFDAGLLRAVVEALT